jgi:hypothetical protein
MSVDSTGRLIPMIYSYFLPESFGLFVPFQVSTPKNISVFGLGSGFLALFITFFATTSIPVEPLN